MKRAEQRPVFSESCSNKHDHPDSCPLLSGYTRVHVSRLTPLTAMNHKASSSEVRNTLEEMVSVQGSDRQTKGGEKHRRVGELEGEVQASLGLLTSESSGSSVVVVETVRLEP